MPQLVLAAGYASIPSALVGRTPVLLVAAARGSMAPDSAAASASPRTAAVVRVAVPTPASSRSITGAAAPSATSPSTMTQYVSLSKKYTSLPTYQIWTA